MCRNPDCLIVRMNCRSKHFPWHRLSNPKITFKPVGCKHYAFNQIKIKCSVSAASTASLMRSSTSSILRRAFTLSDTSMAKNHNCGYRPIVSLSVHKQIKKYDFIHTRYGLKSIRARVL